MTLFLIRIQGKELNMFLFRIYYIKHKKKIMTL